MKKHITYGLCIFSGILLVIGLRSASAAPAVSPPSGNVTPTFSGLTVTGGLTSKTVDVSQNFGVIGETTLLGNTAIIDGFLDVRNKITNSVGTKVVVDKGLDVQGILYVTDTLQSKTANVSGDLTVTGATNLAGDTYAMGKLDAQGNIENSKETMYGSVAVGNPVEITDPQGLKMTKGPLNIKYDELNSSGTPQSAMIINGLVSIKGGILTNRCDGSANMADPTKPSYCMTIGYGDGTPGELAVLWPITTDVDFRKNIKNTKGDVTVNDSLKVTGDINTASIQVSGKAAFLGDTEIKNAYITGSLQNNGDQNGGNIFLDDNIKITGKSTFNKNIDILSYNSVNNPGYLTLGSSIKNSSSAYDSASGYTGPVKIDDDAVISGKVTINGEHLRINAKISDTTTGQPVRIEDDLNVTGNIKTSGTGKIGKYTIRSSGPHSVSGGSTLTKEKACNSGETVISCGYKGDSTSSGDYDFGLELNNLLIGTSSCKVSVKNTIANKLDLSVYTMCFDPTSN